MSKLDDFDKAILAIVQEDASMPLREVAAKVNLSIAAVQRRIRQLEMRKVLQSTIGVIDPAKVGKSITLLVEVQIERIDSKTLSRLKKRFSGPSIQQCYYVTGEADFILVMTVASMEEYEHLAEELFYNDSLVKWFRTIVVMDRVKIGLSVPLAAQPSNALANDPKPND
jgi:Lrp/AsnC family transcriptional regulator, leucine-responsive regulatory protein